MLGTSNYGAQLAAYLGIPYCFAHFITDGSGIKEAIKTYKSEFRPNSTLKEPLVNVCLWALTAKTHEEAKYLFSSRAAWKIGRNFGHLGPITDPDNALNIIHDNNWKEQYELMFSDAIVGEVDFTKNKIKELVKKNDIDEIAILSWCHSETSRVKSYELFAEAFSLNSSQHRQKNLSLN
jgi:alkanesulfonate monooxygenase SsuD/methylene tetrahydromethanopterin reductase-like flavin-dependent oxidoreductase (luciferase family)